MQEIGWMSSVLRAMSSAELADYTWCLEILSRKGGAGAQIGLHEGLPLKKGIYS
jgi:hypothetical protein